MTFEEILHRIQELGLEVEGVLCAGDYYDVTVNNAQGCPLVLCIYPEGIAIGPSDMRSPAYFRWPIRRDGKMMNTVSSQDSFKYFHKSSLDTVLTHLKTMLS